MIKDILGAKGDSLLTDEPGIIFKTISSVFLVHKFNPGSDC